MKIARGISIHPFDDKVYVHSVVNQRDYIFEGIVLDVLNFFATHENAEVDELCAKLLTEYEVDEAELQRDIHEFVEELLAEKILIAADETEEPWSNKIPMEVAAIFAKQHKLFSLALELTWRCPLKCIHCYIDDAPKFPAANELTTDEYKKILRQAREMGCVQVLFTGGEVLLRRDLCDLVEYATELGLIVNVYTTGVGLTDESFERLCATTVNSISFSLYSGVADEHDKITGVKGSFKQTLKAALKFKAAGVNTFIKSVVIQQNLSSIESLYRLGERLNLYVSVSSRIVAGHDGKCAENFFLGNLELYKKFFKLRAHYVPADPTADEFCREAMLDGSACNAGRSSISIDPFGGVHACITFREAFGSVREDDLQTLWERARHIDFGNRRLRDVTPHCSNCKYLRYCTVCVADLKNRAHGKSDDCGETLLMAQAAAAAAN